MARRTRSLPDDAMDDVIDLCTRHRDRAAVVAMVVQQYHLTTAAAESAVQEATRILVTEGRFQGAEEVAIHLRRLDDIYIKSKDNAVTRSDALGALKQISALLALKAPLEHPADEDSDPDRPRDQTVEHLCDLLDAHIVPHVAADLSGPTDSYDNAILAAGKRLKNRTPRRTRKTT